MDGTVTGRRMRFTTSVHTAGVDPIADAECVRDAITKFEVVQIRVASEPEDLRSYYDALVEASGTPVDIAEDHRNGGVPTGERWSEIRYDAAIPDEEAFRYSKNAQPLHTDESYVSTAAGVMLFYCVAAAPEGGETIFVSGQALVDHLRSVDPALLSRLLTTNVRYQKANDFKDRPIIELRNGVVDLNYNYFCVEPDQPGVALALNQEFRTFIDDLPEDLILPVGLRPGDAVTWRDNLVLHGRNAFTASASGDRWIWKTGIVVSDRAA